MSFFQRIFIRNIDINSSQWFTLWWLNFYCGCRLNFYTFTAKALHWIYYSDFRRRWKIRNMRWRRSGRDKLCDYLWSIWIIEVHSLSKFRLRFKNMMNVINFGFRRRKKLFRQYMMNLILCFIIFNHPVSIKIIISFFFSLTFQHNFHWIFLNFRFFGDSTNSAELRVIHCIWRNPNITIIRYYVWRRWKRSIFNILILVL